MTETNSKINKIWILLMIASVFLAIKFIFVDFGIDAAFQISMSYRFIDGDIMFREMWEPYQTSTFLCAFFMMLYMGLFHTTVGIVLFLQFVGVMIDLGIAVLLYKNLRKFSVADRNTAFAMSLVFFLISPKDVAIPEYANMQVWFTLLLGIFLFSYLNTKKKYLLILAAVSLCMAVLAYPSCLLLYAAVVCILLKAKDKSRAVILTGICVLLGGLYILFLLSQGLSVNEMISNIHYMLGIETSHSMSTADKILWYLNVSAQMAILFSAIYALIYGGLSLYGKLNKKDLSRTQNVLLMDSLFFSIMLCIAVYVTVKSEQYTRYAYAIIFVALMLIGFKHRKKLDDKQLQYYGICTVLSCTEFAGTLMLTNLGLIASLPYLLVAAITSFIPISKALSEDTSIAWVRRLKTGVVVASALFLLGRNALVIRPLNGDVSTVFKVSGIVKSGPAVGLITEYMGAYIQNETIKEWEEYVPDGSNIYVVGDIVDTLPYLYSDTNISAPSLVPTPGYNDMIAEYWELNPDKYPDMIIVSCWYGSLHISEDSWIMEWIENEYHPSYYIDGKYYRYYYK